MALQLINTGTAANDGTGDTLRSAGQKMNANSSELYGLVADTQGALGEKLEAADIAAFESTTQLIARDTANRFRVNHTGTQFAATIIDFDPAAAAAAPVQSVAGKTGLVSLAQADVGLGNVDNTADLSKPISTATGAALTALAAETQNTLDALTTSDTAQDSAIAELILSDTEQDNAIAAFETNAQLDARDTGNRARANHTGAQAISTVTGLQTALDAKTGLQSTAATLTYAATTNLDMAVLTGTYQTISLTGNLTLTSSNLLAGRTVSVRLLADATARTLTFPAGWRFLGAARPTNIAANKAALLAIVFFGSADTDGLCAYSVEA